MLSGTTLERKVRIMFLSHKAVAVVEQPRDQMVEKAATHVAVLRDICQSLELVEKAGLERTQHLSHQNQQI